MKSRPSATEGWDQWGVINAMGEFEPVYGLESHHDDSSAMYFLAAAGVCQIKGKYKQGTVEVPEQPKIAPPIAEPIQDARAVVQTETVQQPVESVNPITEIPMAHWGLGVLALVGICMVGSIWTRNRVKVNDPTPNECPQGLDVFSRGAEDEQ